MTGRDLSAELFGPAPAPETKSVGKDFSADLFGAPPATSTGKDFSADLFGIKAPRGEVRLPEPEVAPIVPDKKEVRPEDQSFLREVADVPLKLTGGVVTGIRMISDAFGADSAASKNLRGAEDWIAELYSAQSKKDSKRMAEIMKAAEDQGAVVNIIAALNAFKEAPIDLTVNALGTSAPAIIASIGAFLAGAPAAVTTATALGIGAFMGSGTVKGSIYDATKQILTEQNDLKLSPAQIEKVAAEAQAYGGKNTDMILGGTILGALGSSTGAEPIIARQLAKNIISKAVETEAKNAAAGVSKSAATDAAIKAATRKEVEKAAERGIVKQGAITGTKEFGTEFLQGGQEQLAKNIAQQREGYDVPTMRGVVGQGALEGFAGLGMGAVSGGREAYTAKRELAAEKPIDPNLKETFTTAGEDKQRTAVPPTGEDVNMLVPATDKAGKSLTDAAPETLTAKEKADADAAAAAEAAKISLDEATTRANDLLAKVDGGGAVKQTEYRPVAKALGVKIPFGTSNAAAVELIRDHIAQQGVPSVTPTTTDESATGASTSVAGQPSTVATTAGATGAKPSGVVSTGAATQPATTGKGPQPTALNPLPVAAEGEDAMEVRGGEPMPFSALTTPEALERTKTVLNTERPLEDLKMVQRRGGLAEWEIRAILGEQGMPTVNKDGSTGYGPPIPVSPGLVKNETQAQNETQITPVAETKTAAQQDEDLLNDLLGGGDSSLSARRTNAEISRDEQLDKLGNRYGLSRSLDESAKEFGARIKEAIEFEKMREGKPLSAISDQDIAKQTLREETSYIPPDLQIEEYEKQRQKFNESIERDPETGELESDELPAYKELSDDDRRVYFQEGISRPGAGTDAEHARATQRLSDYRSGKKTESFEGETQSREIYNRERSSFGQKTSIAYGFPAWGTLSDASRKLFASINKTNTLLEQDMAFRAVRKQIQAEKAQKSSEEFVAQAEVDANRQMLQAAERARQSQPGGRTKEGQTEEELRKGGILPDHVLNSLYRGDITAVLDYISEHGNGVSLRKASDFFMVGTRRDKSGKVKPIFKKSGIRIRDSVAMGIFRSLASTLGNIDGLKVNVVYDENMIYDQLARYDANTNTLYIGPNGLNETTILHELVHAATVKIIHQFFTDPSVLPERTRKSVERLRDIASAAQKRLGNKYPNAFENLYEFIAYAMTDMNFQYDLAQIQIARLAEATAKTEEQNEDIQLQREATRGATMYDSLADNLWNYYTGTLAYMYKLFTPGAKSTKVLMPTEKSRATTAKTLRQEKAIESQEEIETKKISSDEEETKGLTKREKAKLSAAEKEAFAPEALFDDPDVEMKEAKITPLKGEMVIQNGVANLRREILREPGYKGNLLLEASEMFQLILAAPEGGITQLAGKESIGSELAAKKAAPTPAANTAQPTTEEDKTRSGGLNDPKIRQFYKLGVKEKFASKAEKVWKSISTAAGWRNMVRLYQDKSVEARSLHNKLDMAGLINRNMDEAFNNFDEQRDLSTGEARNFVNNYLRAPMDNLKQSIGDYASLTKQKVEQVLEELHMVAEMFHEPERRNVKWVTSVPLSTKANLTHNGKKISAAQRRIDILGDPRTGKPGIKDRVELTEAQQKQLWAELTALANNHADPAGDSPRIKTDRMRQRIKVMDINKDSPIYNVLGINQAEVNLRTKEYSAMDPERRALLDKIFAEAKEITKATSELNKIGNYWSYPVSNLVGMYNYQHYLPFKGISKHSVADEFIDFDSKTTGKDLQEIEHSADGRFSTSDNPFLQMMSDAFRSAGRAGRRNYMQSIKNAVKANKLNPTGTGVIDGEVAKHIKFEERNTVDLSEFKGGNNIFVYNEDGSIDIIRIKDPKILNALRYSFRDAAPMWDMANAVTGFFGAMHTRYNYNFAPLNFVRDALTNAWTMGAGRLGPLKSAMYIKQISAQVVKNGLGKGMEVAILHEKGDPVSQRMLDNMAKKDPFVRDMVEYLRFGGKTTYLESFSLKSSLQDLNTKLGKRRIMDKVDSFNEFVDVWNNMFEFTSRTAAYSMYKQEVLKKNIAKGMSNAKGPNGQMSAAERAAAVEAAAWTKNLANFEKAGEHAREMGALYMFIRASATGAVRAAEAALPAFRPMSVMLNDLPAEIRDNPEALKNFKAEYAVLQRNASVMITALMGMGFMAFWMSSLMAPDDEWKRNTVKNDNMQQWTRFARFHIPNSVSERLGIGRDVVFQLPWGFGLGSFAAIGAQLAGVTVGNNSIKDALGNVVTSLSDSFLPIPVSKIPPLESSESAAKWVVDTVSPTVFRPIIEWVMNTNGIGQAINSAQTRRMGDAFTGGDRIPEIYKSAARGLFNSTLGAVNISPNTMYFFANSYLDGLAKLGEISYSWANLESGEKKFNLKTDVPLFGSFFGTKTNVDAREYGNIEKRIKELDERLYTLEETSPDKAAIFESKNPLTRPLIDAYKARQGELSKLRAEANQIRNMPGLSPKSRDELLRIVIMQQNILKHEMVMDFKAYGEKP
jgi:hypothetical protein